MVNPKSAVEVIQVKDQPSKRPGNAHYNARRLTPRTNPNGNGHDLGYRPPDALARPASRRRFER